MPLTARQTAEMYVINKKGSETHRDAAHAADDHVERRRAHLHAAMGLLQALEPLLQAESRRG